MLLRKNGETVSLLLGWTWQGDEPMFDTIRELVNADFGEVNELRNIVFHFRRGITLKDTDRLRRFRDRLRYDRELFAK